MKCLSGNESEELNEHLRKKSIFLLEDMYYWVHVVVTFLLSSFRFAVEKRLALVSQVVLYYQPMCSGDCDTITQRVVCYVSLF